jgi:hypothetical protein
VRKGKQPREGVGHVVERLTCRPVDEVAAGDPDPDRGGAGGQRRMDEQRPAPLTGG